MASSLAVKYGRALLDAVAELRREEETLKELTQFQQLLSGHAELCDTLENPALPFSAKRNIVEAIAERLPLSKPVRNFLLVVLENGRMAQFPKLLEGYQQVWDQRRGLLRGRVESAKGLEKVVRDKLEAAIGHLSGHEVKLDYQADPSLIGGLKLQVGSTIFDGSIRTQLKEIERRLTGQ